MLAQQIRQKGIMKVLPALELVIEQTRSDKGVDNIELA